MDQRHHYALLLSGGGARAAYQVGVLKAIATLLPRNHSLPFPVICGTSAGAINATSLACFASCYHLGVRKLEWVWKNFHTHQVYDSNFTGVFGYLLRNYLQGLRSDDLQTRSKSLLNNQPLRQLLKQTLNFKRIDHNILSGHLKAISVSTSSYSSHDSISFFQSSDDLQSWNRAKRRGEKTTINVEHLMASAAIPMVFPSIKLEHEYFGDGSIHQLSPLSTPIHLGAENILVIGVEEPDKHQGSHFEHFPSNSAIAGHLLDTIFADTLNSDLERLERINGTLSLLTAKQRQSTELKEVNCLVINPSQGFNQIASQHYARLPLGIRTLLKSIGIKQDTESSLLSYLLFEGPFCQELINLGYQDGLEQQQKIKNFLAI